VTLMNGTTSGELPDADICMLARLILDAAGEDASLITRSHNDGRDAAVHWHAIPASREDRHLPLALESRVDLTARQHLEEVVSIAVASVQEAEDAVQRAHQFSTRARRGICAAICIGTLLFLVGIAGITDHLPYYKSDRELAGKAGDGLAVAEPQRHVSGQLSELEDHTVAPAPMGPLARLSSTAPILYPGAEEVSAADSKVLGRSTVQPDERIGTTTTPAASQVQRETNAPTGATPQAYPTQPYGINTSTSVQPLVLRPNLWPSLQHRPSYGSPIPKQKSNTPTRPASSVGSGPTGDPVMDFQRFTAAVGRGIDSIFR
jgi:hypothetical protein